MIPRWGALWSRPTERIVIHHGLTVRSADSPEVTITEGEPGEMRCAYLGEGALSGHILADCWALFGISGSG